MAVRKPIGMRKSIALLGAAIGISVLVTQFAIVVPADMDRGEPLTYALFNYFSYFTILTNIALVLIYLGAIIKGQRWLAPFRQPRHRATAAAAIVLVMVFFYAFIAPTLAHDGVLFICDTVLHTVTPILYLVWFARYNRSGTLQWRDLRKMLVPPAFYLAWVMLRGLMIGEYPYAVLETQTLGYPKVALAIVGITIALMILNAGAIAIDRSLLMRETT